MAAKKQFRSNDQREESDSSEFVPFACHYDPSTLLTKNGELLQTIKIVGFTFESVNREGEALTLRATLRNAIQKNLKTNNFAVWFHTVRRKKDLTTGGNYPEEGFADYLNKSWCEKHDWEHKYVNELYVTIIREGQDFKLGVGSFFRGISFAAEKKFRESYLAQSFADLNQTVENILTDMQGYGARRLTMVEKGDVTYSEPIQFFGKILNLKEASMPAPVMDISEYLCTHRTLFGFSALEVVGETGDHFAAILSVKEYHEMRSSAIDEFLQLDQQFVITETFDFINNDLIKSKYEHQKQIMRLSGDKEFAEISGLASIVDADHQRSIDYGEHQITIMLVEDDIKLLEDECNRIMDSFHDLGMVVIREDVMLEDCYWAQLPGNFEFLRRLSPITSSHMGGFASLYNFPAGKLIGNHWGDAVTVFYTKAKTPYFFNFHDENNGHTVIIGPYGYGKTVLLNFLISESIKYDPRVIFFDQHRSSELFLRALGGNYKRLMKDKRTNQLKFNPLLLEDIEDNRIFLRSWFNTLLMDEDYQVDEPTKATIEQAIIYNYSLPASERRLSKIAEQFWPLGVENIQKDVEQTQQDSKPDVDALLKTMSEEVGEEGEKISLPKTPEARLANWYGDGEFSEFFENEKDEFDLSNMICGFDMTEIVQSKWPIVPIISYMLHRITQSLDGRPTIIVLDEAWHLVDNPIYGARLAPWLDKLKEKNAIAIFATESVEDASQSSITSTIIEKISTQIYLPNEDATDAYVKVFGLSENEFAMLSGMEKAKRHLLLKHHGDAVVAELNLEGMDDVIAVLSGNRENIAMVESIILEAGNDPKQWFPVFQQKFKKNN